MDRTKSLIIPVTPTEDWQLEEMKVIITLGRHWPLQKPNNENRGLTDPHQCDGDLYISLCGHEDAVSIEILCDSCKLHIWSGTHRASIQTWETKQLKLALARLMFVGARGNTIFPISLPCINYLDSANHLAADMPLLDTGFSTQDDKKIYLALFLPHKIDHFDLENGEWVPEAAFINLTESSALIINELLNNSRSLELSNKRTIGI